MNNPNRLSKYSKLFNTGKSPEVDTRGLKVYQDFKQRLTTLTEDQIDVLSQFVKDANAVLEGEMDATYFSTKWQLPRMETADDLRIWMEEKRREAEEMFDLMTEEQKAEIDRMIMEMIGGTTLELDLLRMVGNMMKTGEIPQPTEVPDVFKNAFKDDDEEDDESDEGEESEDEQDEEEESWQDWYDRMWVEWANAQQAA